MKLAFHLALLPILAVLSLLHPPQAQESPLDSVLKKMNSAAASFHTTQADFEWDRYEKVIDEVDDVQAGTIYFRRTAGGIDMKADINKVGSSPTDLKAEPKYVLFSNGKIQVYQPKPNQVTVYDAGKNRADVESYLVLGFGGSGQDLAKSYEVSYIESQTIKVPGTAELQLIPKSAKVKSNIARILLWIDLERGISVQQQFFELQGDYRLAKYSGIRVNEKLPSNVFELKTNDKTQTLMPRG